ncbi:hypothetical protein DUNSADRAFT_9583 [Dunaliella salina]|uniref:Nuclear pore complex protein Nup85 n=1 Tax=Dunaliella salina TaxID=3046 RepID=A0ABQ7GH41_DUNSA|nr:hypothetical protein DUNSADRAFT_9583 [Dunaliella salina]|eukprot:KAF5833924.1 hypothetical protein DUNSADRAFT_9583 [Dunaliella salina]
MAEEFDAEDVIAGLAFAAKGGVSLSSPARTKLVGRLLEVAAPKPVPSSASISSTNTGGAGSRAERTSSMPSGAREMMSLDMLRDMMVALLMQADGSSLPGAWMPRMQALVEAHLPSMDPPDMVSALKLLGLLEIPPDETFLQHMVAAYTTALAREEPPKDGTEATASSILGSDEEACLELASGLAAASAPAPIMQVVEDASLHWSPDFSPNAHQSDAQPVQASSGVALEFWVGLLAKFAAGAYLPQQRWWQALAAATLGPVGSSTSSGGGDGTGMMLRSMTDAQLANLLAAYGALRCVLRAQGQAWLEAAGAAAARGLPSADGHDLATLLAACQAIPAFRTYMPTPVVNTLLRTAVQEGAAGGLQPSQMLSLINSAAGLHLDARVGAPHATQLRTLLDQAAGMRESFPPAGLAQLAAAMREKASRLQGWRSWDGQAGEHTGFSKECAHAHLADHAGLVYSLARLSPTKAAAEPARAGSSTSSSSSEAAKEEGPAAAVAAARQGLLEALMPATAAALPSYSVLELVTIFSSFGALGAPLPPAWLDVFWEYSRPQVHACPVPMLAACLDAVASLKVRPAGAWEGALWSALSSRASRLSLTDIDQLVAALSRAQLRPPEPLLQQLLEAALVAAGVPAASPETAQQMAANIPAASSDAGTRQEDVVGSTRTRRSERAAPATANNGSGSASSEDASAAALAAAQMGRRAVQLSRVLGVANRGMGYQPPSEWMDQFRGVAATALSSRQLPPQERSMLMDVMQATASMP